MLALPTPSITSLLRALASKVPILFTLLGYHVLYLFSQIYAQIAEGLGMHEFGLDYAVCFYVLLSILSVHWNLQRRKESQCAMHVVIRILMPPLK